MAQAARDLFSGFQNEGKRPWCSLFEQAVLAVVDARVVGNFAQVAAQQGEVVLFVDTAQLAQAVTGLLVVDVAGQRITGIGGDSQNFAGMMRGCGLTG